MIADAWTDYLADYHRAHPGITETLLEAAPRADVGTAYDWMRSAVPARPGSVVDLACGSAPLQPLLQDADSYLGVDRSVEELSVAASRGRGKLVQADARELPVEDASVDVVLCSMAIMLMQPVEDALAEVSRILRPGGLLVTIRPVGWPARAGDLRVASGLVLGLRHLPEMPQRFGRRRLGRLLAEAGLRVTDDRALRFAHPLQTPADAALVVEGLYLPHVPADRRRAAVARLARIAEPGREVPLAVRRTVAVKS